MGLALIVSGGEENLLILTSCYGASDLFFVSHPIEDREPNAGGETQG